MSDERSEGAGIPRGYCCAPCGYPSGESGSRTCPECGHDAGADEIRAWTTRADSVHEWDHQLEAQTVIRWLLTVCVFGVGASIVARSVVAAPAAFLLLGACLITGWAGASVPARIARKDHRAFRVVAWRREMWGLQLPWLVAPLAVLGLLLAGFVDVWAADTSGTALGHVAVLGFWLWVLGCVGAFVGWWRRFQKRLSRAGITPGRPDALSFALGAIVFSLATAAGFAAGLAAVSGVSSWLVVSPSDVA